MPPAGTDEIREQIDNLQKELTQKKRQLNELRHSLPPEPVAEYRFINAEGREAGLSDLFGDRRDLIVVHNMGKSCPYCTLWADGFNGMVGHFTDRAVFVVVSPDPPDVQRQFAESRGWTFDMWSPQDTRFLEDMKMAGEKGEPWPGVSVFKRQVDGSVVRTGYDYFGPGDYYCSIWHIMELFPEGVAGWKPKWEYK